MSKAIYQETNRRAEKWSGSLFFLANASLQMLMWPKFIANIIIYFTKDRNSLKLLFPMWWVHWFLFAAIPKKLEIFVFCTRLPFVIKHPVEYVTAFAVQYLVFAYAIFFTASCMAFGVVSCLMFLSVTKDLKHQLDGIAATLKFKKNRMQIMTQFPEFIQFHSDSKQLSGTFISMILRNFPNFNFLFRLVKDFSALCQPNTVPIFVWSIFAICESMLLLQMNLV